MKWHCAEERRPNASIPAQNQVHEVSLGAIGLVGIIPTDRNIESIGISAAGVALQEGLL